MTIYGFFTNLEMTHNIFFFNQKVSIIVHPSLKMWNISGRKSREFRVKVPNESQDSFFYVAQIRRTKCTFLCVVSSLCRQGGPEEEEDVCSKLASDCVAKLASLPARFFPGKTRIKQQ